MEGKEARRGRCLLVAQVIPDLSTISPWWLTHPSLSQCCWQGFPWRVSLCCVGFFSPQFAYWWSVRVFVGHLKSSRHYLHSVATGTLCTVHLAVV